MNNNDNNIPKKELITLEDQLSSLSPSELLDITEKIDDYLVPRDIAAKLKQVSKTSIVNAINRGVLREVEGITLRSLLGYKVDNRRKIGGNANALKRLKEKLLKLELENSNSNKEFEEGDN